MQPECVYGSTTPGNYLLSVRDTYRVRHYQMYNLNDDEFCFLWLTFETIPNLIPHYSQEAGDLCWPLKQKKGIHGWQIDHSTIKLTTLIDACHLYKTWEGKWKCHIPAFIKIPGKESTCVNKFLEKVKLMRKLKHNNIIDV